MAQRSQSTKATAAAPAKVPAASPATAAPGKAQAGGAAVAVEADLAPGLLDLKAMGATFKPPAEMANYLEAHPKARVRAQLGKLAQGTIEVQREGKSSYRVRRQRLPLAHPLFSRIAEAAPGLAPCLVLDMQGEKISGQVGLAAGARLNPFDDMLQKAPGILGLAGIRFPSLSGVVNTLEGGRLKLGVQNVGITLGQSFSGKLSLAAEDEAVSFDASASIAVKGLANGQLEMKRSAEGLITGRATVGLQLPKNFSGSIEVGWDGRAISGEGKVGYQGEKLQGEVTLRLMEREAALQFEQQKKAPPEQSAPTPAPAAASTKKVDYVVFGEGDLSFAFNAWLNGTAHVIVDPKGFVTIIGKITPTREFELFPQKDYVRQLFKIEVRASYGLPVVGNIFIFANVSMDAFAKLGPAKFYKIVAQGTYSTDPAKCQDFSIQGTLNISAAAGVRLRGEAGAGLEILGHDIKAGAGVNGIAGIKGYAEATPIIGYRENAKPGEDKKGEWFIRGDMEIVAQPFLGLSGDLFVEVDAPWWSPISDDRWTWPLGGKEWPLGGPLGIGASVDYVFGSGQWPKLDLKPVEFSPDKFMTDLYSDKAKSGKGGEVASPGQWKEKNSASASPPPKASPKGNAAPGKAAAAPAAKSRVKPGGSGKAKDADPNARTAGGKTVKQLQDEAVKKGKKAPGEAAKGATGGPGKAGTESKAPADPTEALKREKAEFSAGDGSRHKVFLDPAASDGRVVAESKRTYLSDLIKDMPKSKSKEKADAERRQRKIVELIREGKSAKSPQTAQKVAVAMQAELDGLAADLKAAGVLGVRVLPAPSYSFGVENAEGGGKRAKKASVKNLSAARQQGSSPGSANPAGWAYAQAVGLTTSGPGLRRLHLINDRFGGPGMNENLAVAGKTDNENHLYWVENAVKKVVGDVPNEKDTLGVVTEYSVEAVYGRKVKALVSKPPKSGETANLNDFPTAFKCALSYFEHSNPAAVKKADAVLWPKWTSPITFGNWGKDVENGSQ